MPRKDFKFGLRRPEQAQHDRLSHKVPPKASTRSTHPLPPTLPITPKLPRVARRCSKPGHHSRRLPWLLPSPIMATQSKHLSITTCQVPSSQRTTFPLPTIDSLQTLRFIKPRRRTINPSIIRTHRISPLIYQIAQSLPLAHLRRNLSTSTRPCNPDLQHLLQPSLTGLRISSPTATAPRAKARPFTTNSHDCIAASYHCLGIYLCYNGVCARILSVLTLVSRIKDVIMILLCWT